MNHRMKGVAFAFAVTLATAACTDTHPIAPDPASASGVRFEKIGPNTSSGSSTAAQPEPNVTITVFVHHLPDGGIEGTWIATGAFTDQGTVDWTGFNITGGPPIFSAGHVMARTILRGDRGTFEMHSREHWITSPDPHNTWIAGHGTGFYENLEGMAPSP